MVCFAAALWHGLFFDVTELWHGLFLLSWLVFSLFNAADLWHGLCCVATTFVFLVAACFFLQRCVMALPVFCHGIVCCF